MEDNSFCFITNSKWWRYYKSVLNRYIWNRYFFSRFAENLTESCYERSFRAFWCSGLHASALHFPDFIRLIWYSPSCVRCFWFISNKPPTACYLKSFSIFNTVNQRILLYWLVGKYCNEVLLKLNWNNNICGFWEFIN